jgi:cytochrome P450
MSITGTLESSVGKAYALPPEPPLPMPLQTMFWIQRPTEMMEQCKKRYGSAFTLALAPFRIALFSDPESIRAIFAAKPEEMHAGEVNRILRVLVGQSSVLLLDGQEHLRHRKLLMPSFHGERMRLYGETMAEITRDVMARWPEHEPFVLHEHTQEITLQVILRTVFGADAGSEEQKLGDQIKRMLSAAESRLSIMPMVFLADRNHLEDKAPWKWLLKRRNAVDATIFEQIARRRNDPDLSKRQDVLSMLLAARDEDGAGMSDVELRDELMTALAAGHETTATGLAWAFERLLSNPATYDRLRDEVRACGESPDPEKLATLPYLDATVKEVLRLRPVVPVVGRVLKKDTRLGGYDMKAGTAVGACIYLAHRNPNVYPEPERFKPERWLGVTPDPTTWLPFGGGIRRCVGAAFALYEMKIVLGTMLAARDFELAQPKDARVRRRAITFWPEGGTRLTTRKRVTPKRAA